MSDARAVVVFDGGCGFCTWCVRAAERYVGASLDYRPYQRANLEHLGVTREQAEQAVLVIEGVDVKSGASAVAAILRAGHVPWPWLGAIIDAPGVRVFADRGYQFVARHRGKLPGSAPALTADPPPEEQAN